VPRVDVPVQAPAAADGVELTNTSGDAANNHEFVNDGRTVLIVKNGGGAAVTVDIIAVACSHGRVGDISKSVGVGLDFQFGPLPAGEWNQTNGKVNVDISVDASVELIALRR
jgi:hypothetical protein